MQQHDRMIRMKQLEAAFRTSAVVAVVRDIWETSEAVDTARRTIESVGSKLLAVGQWIERFDKTDLRELIRSSKNVYSAAERSIETVWESSRVAEIVATTIHWWQRSLLHHWMTNPRDPAIVAIDLKDVMIAGRIIAYIDDLIESVVNDR